MLKGPASVSVERSIMIISAIGDQRVKEFYSRLADWTARCKESFSPNYPNVDWDSKIWLKNDLKESRSFSFLKTSPPKGSKPGGKLFDSIEALEEPYNSLAKCIAYEQLLLGGGTIGCYSVVQMLRCIRDLCDSSGSDITDLTEQEVDAIIRDEALHTQVAFGWLYQKMYEWHFWTFKRPVIFSSNFSKREAKGKIKSQAAFEDLTSRVVGLFEAYDRIDEKSSDGQDLFSVRQKMAICGAMLLFCAPTRKNELLAMKQDCLIDISSYMIDSHAGQESHVYYALWQKGSKGGDTGAKQVLGSMINTARDCIARIKESNRERRAQLKILEQNDGFFPPNKDSNFLSSGLISWNEFACHTHLARGSGEAELKNRAGGDINHARERRKDVDSRTSLYPLSEAMVYAKESFEKTLLTARLLVSTSKEKYSGEISDLLFLVEDRLYAETDAGRGGTYSGIPQILAYDTFAFEFSAKNPDSIFKKAGIRYVTPDGVEKTVYINAHEPRHWLTTLAKGSNLTDVLVNKWTRRKTLNQIGAYQWLTKEEEALLLSNVGSTFESITLTKSPSEPGFELRAKSDSSSDIKTLATLRKDGYIVKKNDRERVVNVSPFGLCDEDVYDSPCAKLKQSKCIGCGTLWVIKGDPVTNSYIQEKWKEAQSLMLAQARYLYEKRHFIDDEERLYEHLEVMLDKYARTKSKEELGDVADFILERFKEIPLISENNSLFEMADRAWILRGFCRLLDDPTIEYGAGIRYEGGYHGAARDLPMPTAALALEEQGFKPEKLLTEGAVMLKLERSDA